MKKIANFLCTAGPNLQGFCKNLIFSCVSKYLHFIFAKSKFFHVLNGMTKSFSKILGSPTKGATVKTIARLFF